MNATLLEHTKTRLDKYVKFAVLIHVVRKLESLQ